MKMKYSKTNLPKADIEFKRVLNKDMMLRKNGEAWHCLGDIRRDYLEWEPIFVYAEDGDDYWVGYFREGYGLTNVRFLKSDCRDMTDEEKLTYDAKRETIVGFGGC